VVLSVYSANVGLIQIKIKIENSATLGLGVSATKQLSEYFNSIVLTYCPTTEQLSGVVAGLVIRSDPAHIDIPHREGNFVVEPRLFSLGIQNGRGCCENQSLCRSCELNPGISSQGPLCYLLLVVSSL